MMQDGGGIHFLSVVISLLHRSLSITFAALDYPDMPGNDRCEARDRGRRTKHFILTPCRFRRSLRVTRLVHIFRVTGESPFP